MKRFSLLLLLLVASPVVAVSCSLPDLPVQGTDRGDAETSDTGVDGTIANEGGKDSALSEGGSSSGSTSDGSSSSGSTSDGSSSSGSTSDGSSSSGSSSGSTSDGSSSSGSTSDGSSSGSVADAGSSTNVPVPVNPTSTGYVNVAAINLIGTWFAYGDGLGTNGAPPGDCENKGGFPASSCSSITFPPGPPADGGPASFPPFPTDAGVLPLGTMCLSGVAAQVVGFPPDYSDIFGMGIGLDFNNPHGTVGTYDASKISALTFTVTGLPTDPGTRVNIEFEEPATDVPPSDAWSYQITTNGPTTVFLVAGPTGQLVPAFIAPFGSPPQPAFDTTMLEGIRFHVVTNSTNPIHVAAFCISDLTAVFTL